MIGTYALSTVLIWVCSGEKLSLFIPFVLSGLNFAGSYSEVMATDFIHNGYTYPDFVFMIGLCCAYAVMLIYLFVRRRFYSISWFIIAPHLFLVFKETFVRSDTVHVQNLSHYLLYVLCFLLYVLKELGHEDLKKDKVIAFNKYFWPVVVCLLIVPQVLEKGWFPTTTAYSDYYSVGTESHFNETADNNLRALRASDEYKTLYEDIEPYPEQTLGMFSGEQTFFIAYDLMDRFKLNPIISLWENVSPETETMAASQYSGDQAPEVLLYRPESLDGGYTVFHMGTILRSMLENYHLDKTDQYGYLVLRHNDQISDSAYEIGESRVVKAGDYIEIPKVDDAYVFMKVDWELSPIGTLAKFILKPSRPRVEIVTDSGKTFDYPFWRTLAQNGIYVSSMAVDSAAMADLFRGDCINNSIQKIRFYDNDIFYKKDIKISFFAVPFTEEQKDLETITIDFSSDLQPGEYYFFYAQDNSFDGNCMKKVFVGEEQRSLTFAIPRDGWNTLRLDFPEIGGCTYNITSISYEDKIGVVDGANDATFITTDDGYQVLSGETDPYILFHLEADNTG